MMAMIIKIAPMPEIMVKASPSNSVAIVTATIISVSNATEDVTGEMCFSPFSQR